ncbi:hypothetical protein INP83_13070 [Mucilaginibacter sp. 21P]|uniref:hypothetical protein n=1 Tax=Mucilaginibacter sp. 21P TaxID=2778902 RepID=UPI001C586DEA|nr:hypothetical protein [Mucilaginibacter sp. 21P]QXV64026.1 hypothetical protein INP83_13070 [Mucilaginibacter sp. 21P]
MSYPIEPLHSGLNKKDFTCGVEMLDNYLHKQASQDIKRRLSTVSVMLDGDRIIGYYSYQVRASKRAGAGTSAKENAAFLP